MMASYRSGTLRGRDEAARLDDTDPGKSPQWNIPQQDPPGTHEGR
jgi:hypothetical protein